MNVAKFGEQVYQIIDTAAWDDISGIGRIDDGVLTSYHVTDRPEEVVRFLRRHGDLVAAYGERGQTSELGPGLYLSGVPEYWISRQRGRWDFLQSLTQDEMRKIALALARELDAQRESRYISASEHEYARRLVESVMRGDLGMDALTCLTGQPVNIAWWKPEYLARFGVKPAAAPRAVEVRLAGKLAELRWSKYDPGLFRRLRKLGIVGAFTRASMGSNPELVLWQSRAVKDARVIEI